MPESLLTDTLPSNFSWDMIQVPGGTFLMGSDEYKETLNWEGPVHQVTGADFTSANSRSRRSSGSL
ncbi:MAG: hypothetical protein ACKVT2_02780 [Saprospiraceae bacterium]